jgi:PilZ domain-containing protein
MSGFDRYAGPTAAVRSRRLGERATLSCTVWVQAGQQRMRCHTVDVSARGAKLRPRGLFPVGTPLQMEFIKPDGQRLRVSGVAWRAEADALAVMFLGTIPPGFNEVGYHG